MTDERAGNETETGEVTGETAAESEYTSAYDPVAEKRRLLELIDEELDESPKGVLAKEIVDGLPIEG